MAPNSDVQSRSAAEKKSDAMEYSQLVDHANLRIATAPTYDVPRNAGLRQAT